jgi:hypothetical protein
MNKIIIPQQDNKPKKIYKAEIEGEVFEVKASVLVAKESTEYFNKLQRILTKPDGLETLEEMYNCCFKLFDILLGKQQAEKLIGIIDDKYDTETGQLLLIKLSSALYSISSGQNQEVIDNIFFK